MLRVAIAVHEAHRDGLDPRRVAQVKGGSAHALPVEGDEHLACGVDTAFHLDTPSARDQRGRRLEKQVVEGVTDLAPDLDRVTKALRGDESHPRPGALDDGIGHQRRSVNDAADIGWAQTGLGEDAFDAVQDSPARLVRSRQQLLGMQPVAGTLGEDQVRERAADVHSDPGAAHEVPLSSTSTP